MTSHRSPERPDLDDPPQDLRRRLDELPRVLEPARDLWPSIEARLRSEAAPLARPAAGPARWRSRHLALAAMLAATLGAGATWWVVAPPSAAPRAAEPAGEIRTVSTPDWARVEQDYQRARASLLLVVQSKRSRLSPATLDTVERNLAIIDAAIGELRRAVADDPGNTRLGEELLNSHRRSLDLLRKLADEA